MATITERNMENRKANLAIKTPPIVSSQEWEAARQQLLVKEKALTRSRDALAAERRRMPWIAVEKKYEFDGPKGKVSLLDLLRQGPRTTTQIVEAFPHLSRFGVMKHIEVLRGADLIHTREERRQRINSLSVVPIRQIYERWVGRFEELWASHLLRIKEDAEANATSDQVPGAGVKKRPKAS